jgi:hypothetical protein
MDNEDSRSASTTSGWVGATLVDGNRNTHFYFCRTNGTSFGSLASSNSASNNYAVLKLGTTCPSGSVPFSRRFDNEDHNNLNDFTGSTGVSNLQIAPNMSFRSPSETTLVFCLFKGDGPLVAKLPALPFSYGVFAAQSFQWTSAHGSIFTDDEDDNANGYDVDPSWQTAAQQIIVPGGNTILNTARAIECGDNLCSAGENIDNCFADCDVCGNGTCRANEDPFSCPQDCTVCGDGICSGNEDSSWCSDCMSCSEGICQDT